MLILTEMSNYQSTKLIELGSCAFRQWRANPEHATSGLTRLDSKCHLIHGYQLKAKFIFGCSELDERNWVTDFGSLKQLKAILNNQFDHTLCIAENDPLLEEFKSLHEKGGCDLRIMSGVGIEKTAEWCFNTASTFITEKYGDRCWVEKVEVYEHEANSAIYSKPTPISYTVAERPVITDAVSTQTLPDPPPAPTPVTAHTPEPPSRGAAVGNKVTTGWSNPFGGTSWGA